MKKILSLILMITMIFTFNSVKADTFILTFEVYSGSGYDLNTGKYKEAVYLSSSDKMSIGANEAYSQIELTSTNFHHLLFFDKYNKYIGYINGNGSSYEGERYLGYDADIITTYPTGAKTFAIVNYDYDAFRDTVAVTNPTIDDPAWSDLTYRDIFGDSLFGGGSNNLLENGDFASTLTNWYGIYSTLSIENETLKIVSTTAQLWSHANYDLGSYQDHTIYYSYDILNDTTPEYYRTQLQNRYSPYASVANSETMILNEWFNVSDTITFTANSGDIRFMTNMKYLDTLASYTYYIDDIMLYDLTDIFNGYTMPTQEQFETMLTFYKQYVDAPETLTYAEIFGNDTQYGGSNNLTDNGDFSDDLDNWGVTTSNVSSYGVDNYFYYTKLEGGLSKIVEQTQVIESVKYYFSFDSISEKDTVYFGFAGINILQNQVSSEFVTNAMIYDSVYDFSSSWRIQDTRTNTFTLVKIDNIKAYNLTDTFYSGLEPDQATFESYYNSWVDPLDNYYSTYYDAASMALLTFTYDYITDDYEMPDTDTRIDNLLDSIGMNSDGDKVFIAIVILIGVVIFAGILSRSAIVTMALAGVMYIILVAIGFIDVWTLVVAGVILGLLIFLKIKGGS